MKITKVKFALFYHMHQPYYGAPEGRLLLPWVRLHGKDYRDMGLLVERHPPLKVNFNLTPVLIEQIEKYSQGATDTALELTLKEADKLTENDKKVIFETFFSAHPKWMISPYPGYLKLLYKKGEGIGAFQAGDWRDLQVWFNLAWMGAIARAEAPPIKALIEKGSGFSEVEKRLVIDKQLTILRSILPLYRKLQDDGRIEVTACADHHPLLPLLPSLLHRDDVKHEILMGIKKYEGVFGRLPKGMFLPECAISEEIIPLILEVAPFIKWVIADTPILRKSTNEDLDHSENWYKKFLPWKFEVEVSDKRQFLKIAFRDLLASNDLSFRNPDNFLGVATKVVADVEEMARNFSKFGFGFPPLFTIAMDGENVQDSRPNDNYEGFCGFYQALLNSSLIETTTISEYIDSHSLPELKLDHLNFGSWGRGNDFRIWKDSATTDKMWNLLNETRKVLKEKAGDPTAWKYFYQALGSDFLWVLGGEYGRIPELSIFDLLFRANLGAVYSKLKLPLPLGIQNPIIT